MRHLDAPARLSPPRPGEPTVPADSGSAPALPSAGRTRTPWPRTPTDHRLLELSVALVPGPVQIAIGLTRLAAIEQMSEVPGIPPPQSSSPQTSPMMPRLRLVRSGKHGSLRFASHHRPTSLDGRPQSTARAGSHRIQRRRTRLRPFPYPESRGLPAARSAVRTRV